MQHARSSKKSSEIETESDYLRKTNPATSVNKHVVSERIYRRVPDYEKYKLSRVNLLYLSEKRKCDARAHNEQLLFFSPG
jgi:hypothetical protein